MAMYGRVMPGEKGWRSPLPDWWVSRANDRIRRRGIDKKGLAKALEGSGRAVSEMMVIRALHPIESKRVATLETLDAISDALALPRPVVVAATYEQALELQATVAFDAVARDAHALAAEVEAEAAERLPLQSGSGSGVSRRDGRTTRDVEAVERGGQQAGADRPEKARRAPRAR